MPTTEAVRVSLATAHGEFDVSAFEMASGHVYVAMVRGEIGDGEDVLVRLHSECLTGDALGSLRCDCGVQLHSALRTIAAEQRGVLVYATGHEGRGIGLVNKLRAYVQQDAGADTVDANVALGLPIDSRDYAECAEVLAELGVRTIRLLTNNPRKVSGLRSSGAVVTAVTPLPTAPHHRNLHYLTTKAERLDHVLPTGKPVGQLDGADLPVDAMTLLGPVRPRPERPYIALKYAQSLDGRIATATGDARWISGEEERRMSHTLRAASDAVMVGIGTAIRDNPELTVRMVPGASPRRIVLDTTLRLPTTAKLASPTAAPTTVITTARSDPGRREALMRRHVGVEVVAEHDGRVCLRAALAMLRNSGTECLLVEGGAGIITSLLSLGLVDRIIVGIAPVIIGTGVEAVNALGVQQVADAIHLRNRTIAPVGDDVIFAWDVDQPSSTN